MSIAKFSWGEYYAFIKSVEPKRKGEWCVMDDYDVKEFYKEEIAKLIEQISDTNVLDLVYKILLIEGKKVSTL